MSKKTGTIEKVVIGALGVIGGLLIGKAVGELTKEQKQEAKVEQEVTHTDIENYDKIQELMTCPITCCIMTDPVIIPECGHNFEKKDIIEYISKNGKCPLCRTQTTIESLRPNFQLKSIIDQYEKSKKEMKVQTKQ